MIQQIKPLSEEVLSNLEESLMKTISDSVQSSSIKVISLRLIATIRQLQEENKDLKLLNKAALEDRGNAFDEAEKLRKTLQALVDKIDILAPFINNIFLFYHAHGQKYQGPDLDKELKNARDALK